MLEKLDGIRTRKHMLHRLIIIAFMFAGVTTNSFATALGRLGYVLVPNALVYLTCGRRVGTAEGRVTDTEGRLLAHGTTTCLIFPS